MFNEIEEFSEKYKFSEREKEVFSLLVNQITDSKQIAAELGISPKTIDNHFRQLERKSHTRDKCSLAALYVNFLYSKYKTSKLFYRTPQILVVDDEPDICEIISSYLSSKGFRVYSTTDPTEVIEYIRGIKIDFVISDIRMPNVTGVDIIKEIKRVYNYNPAVIFVTGASIITEEEGKELGATEFFNKPLDLEKLLFAIVYHFIESPEDREQFQNTACKIQTEFDGAPPQRMISVGFDSAFIQVDEETLTNHPKFQLGSNVRFSFSLPNNEKIITTSAKVTTQTLPKGKTKDTVPGVKLSFTRLNKKDSEDIQTFVRHQKLKSYSLPTLQ